MPNTMPNTEPIDLYTLLTWLDELERGAARSGSRLCLSDPTAQPPIVCRWHTWHSGTLTLLLDPDRILPEHLPAIEQVLHTAALYSPLLLTNTH